MIKHRDDFLAPKASLNSKLAGWISTRFLGSLFMFDLAFTVPLAALLPHMQFLYRIMLIISGNWIQLFALFVLQRSQLVIQKNQDAKADADHHNVEQILQLCQSHDEQLQALQHRSCCHECGRPETATDR